MVLAEQALLVQLGQVNPVLAPGDCMGLLGRVLALELALELELVLELVQERNSALAQARRALAPGSTRCHRP